MEPAKHIDVPDLRHLRRRADNAAAGFDETDFVHTHTRDALFERMQAMLVDVKTVLDLGSATGNATRALSKFYRGASILSLDLSHSMLQAAARKKRWFSRQHLIQAQANALPFASHSIDVVFSNLLLPWTPLPEPIFSEVARVLRKGGLFVFATLGPDSLAELRRAWQTADSGPHVQHFPDMHDVGDGLLRAGLLDPVLDVDRLVVSYDDDHALFRDLTATAARNCLQGRRRSLTGKQRFRQMQAALDGTRSAGKIELGLELVYGHCWGSGLTRTTGEQRIDAGAIPRRAR